MIVAEQKPLEEITGPIQGLKKVLVAGCNECVTVCEAGGRKEVGILASALRLYFANQGQAVRWARSPWSASATGNMWPRPRKWLMSTRAVVSIACGVGCQFMAEGYPDMPIYPGLTPSSWAARRSRGIWGERCQGCGSCILAHRRHLPGEPLRQTRAQRPLRGSTNGKCEISKEVDCAWQLIVDRLEALGRMDDYEKVAHQGLVHRPGRRPQQGGEGGRAAHERGSEDPQQTGKDSGSGNLAVTSNAARPEGSDPEGIKAKGEMIKDHVDAINITDNQTS
jgi:ferredoxin